MKNTYQIVVNWSNAGQAFLADVPELSGCIADGKSFEEAIENVKIIMEEYLAISGYSGRYAPQQTSNNYYANRRLEFLKNNFTNQHTSLT